MAAPTDSNAEVVRALIKCVDFAAVKHEKQRRKNSEKTPYINHPIGVAKIITDAGITDVDVIQAAVLHDTVEDTDTTFEELEQNFGKRVRDIVDEVSDDKTLDKATRKQLQIERAPHKSRQAKLVGLADKIYNVKDMLRSVPNGWTDERVREYVIWARDVTQGYRGTNEIMEKELDRIFKSLKIEEK